MEHTLKKYGGWTKEIDKDFSKLRQSLRTASSIPRLMEIEGKIHQSYYTGFSEALKNTQFEFESRNREPPEDEVNAILSYVNTLVYSRVVTELYYTRLDQSISFLHEPQERRFSLSLDIAEIYKPLIGHRIMLSLLKQRKLQLNDFEKTGNAVLLSDSGRKTVLQEFDEKLNTTREHPALEEPARWRRWIRIEGHKLAKHILEIHPYSPTTVR